MALTLGVAGPASAATTTRAHVAAAHTVTTAQVAAAKATFAKAARAKCVGRNNSSIQWFGHQVKLDSCNTNRLVAGLAAGAAGAGIVAAILAATGVGGATAGVIAGALAGMSAIIAYCGANGDGVILDESWVGAAWCASQ